MNKLLAHLGVSWERRLFFLLLLGMFAAYAAYQYLRTAPVTVIPTVKAMPAIPALVPWEDRPLSFMTPAIAMDIPNPFLVAFNLPTPPPAETTPDEPAPPETPPPPPRTLEVTYTGIYHSLLGKTIAYLKCVDSENGERLANLTIGDEIEPGFPIAEITAQSVTITPNDAESIQIPWNQSQTLVIPTTDKQNN